MKRFVCSLLACVFLICSIGCAESLDLSSLSPEQLEALQQMINAELDAKQDQPGAVFSDCVRC